MKLIDGKKIAEDIRMEIKTEVARLIEDEDKAPHLAAIIVGEDPASQTYVAGKEKACKSVGFMSSIYKLPETTSEKELLELIMFLNKDTELDGFIVQLPLPAHISEEKVIQSIDPAKDVDGFNPVNLGRMISGLPAYLPATPYGIVQLLERYNIETEGKHCVVLGRSNIVGTPVSILLSRKASPGNCTVTVCHSKTKNIKEWSASADILIAAIGQKEFVTADMVKDNAVVIDVGIHRVPSKETKSGFRLKGDVKFDEVAKKCSYITPVPGGVGPMTITGLLQNTLKAFKKEIYD
ncbi:MAG: bifunctional methylenetetrahydrofolate dehydrogenase/methenyltetrahydrofolate cyclohydrolase FolD [Bacteroidetes bacterium]|nr:bifunctional methylenetetrahydrofolate dehydrogenase/methenyltetrahydrofolate cyclohydrolase FolD [Bacteroidota bacterium]